MGQEYLPNRVGTASGVTLGLAVTAGGLAAPLLGLVADRWGLAAPLLVVSAIPLLAVAIALTLPGLAGCRLRNAVGVAEGAGRADDEAQEPRPAR